MRLLQRVWAGLQENVSDSFGHLRCGPPPEANHPIQPGQLSPVVVATPKSPVPYPATAGRAGGKEALINELQLRMRHRSPPRATIQRITSGAKGMGIEPCHIAIPPSGLSSLIVRRSRHTLWPTHEPHLRGVFGGTRVREWV